jgi:hypothetical protein
VRRHPRRARATALALASAALVAAVSTTTLPAAAAEPPPAQDTTAFCANVPADFGGFTDIETNIHRRTIRCLAYARITQGRTSTTFAPGDPVTRGEMATFIARTIDRANDLEVAALQDLPPASSDEFTDDDGSTHEDSINRLAAAGVVDGRTDASFAPGAIVTRDQMARFINNAQEFLSNGVAFTTVEDYFVDDETSVHEASINGIASGGITAGIDATHYGPLLPVLRANMATFIVRYLALLHEVGAIEALPEELPAPTAQVTSVGERSAVITIDDLISGATATVYLAPDGAPFSSATEEASSSSDADPAKAGFQVALAGLTPATSYEYYVTQTSEGQESPPRYTTAGPGTSLVTAGEAAPSVSSASVSGGRPGTQLLLELSEPATPLAGAGPKVTVECTTVVVVVPTTTFSGTGLSVTQVDADTVKVNLDGTVPADGSTCTAAVAAGAFQDADGHANAAQSDIAVP